jgi:hypothetical protein
MAATAPTLKVEPSGVDASAMPESRVHALPLTTTGDLSDWNSFIDRFGITAAVGLLAATLIQCVNQNANIETAGPIPGLQLLLVLIMVGCVGVLSHSRTRTPS